MFRTTQTVPCSEWHIKASTAPDALTIANLSEYPYIGHLDDPDAPLNDLNFGAPRSYFLPWLPGPCRITYLIFFGAFT
jgi:hypothetical protein